MSSGPWLFCHLPKTAGTSFRAALEAGLGEEHILRDYGPRSAFTTPELQARLQQAPAERDWTVLGGHFDLSRYARNFRPEQVLTFVRRPLQQLVSHWEHHRRHQDYTGSLEDFAQQRSGAGLQSRMLGGMPVQLLGLVGLTEEWEQSLALFNRLSGSDLQPLWSNRNPDKEDPAYDLRLQQLPPAARAAVRQDFWLHLQARRVLQRRVQAQQEGRPWMHGAVLALQADGLQGAAWWADDPNRPATIRLCRSGQPEQLLPVAETVSWPLPFAQREGRGFRAQWAQPLQLGEVVDLYCADTGQWLDSQEWRGPAEELMRRPAPDAHFAQAA